MWNGTANIAGNLVGGNFLIGLYAILHVNDATLGLLTTLIQFCNMPVRIFQPCSGPLSGYKLPSFVKDN
jgi:hypothetical protein